MLNDKLPIGIKGNTACNITIENGEIILSGKSVFNGYLNSDTKITKYKTGDYGFFNNNMLYFNGRCDDTVKLNGEGFDVLVENGQKVKKGDPMLKLDLEYLKHHAPSIVTPVICTELEDNQQIRLLKEGKIQAGEPLYAIDILE